MATRLNIGDTVRILPAHRGYCKGRIGTVKGFESDGHVRVRVANCIWARVRPGNLEVLDSKKEDGAYGN